FVLVSGDYSQGRLCVMNADGSQVRPLSSADVRGALYPVWSPDGQWIAFSSVADGGLELFVIHPDGAGQRRLKYLGFMNGFAAWASDSRSITFAHAQPDGNWSTYLRIDVEGTRLGPSPLGGPHYAETPARAFCRPASRPAASSSAEVVRVANGEEPGGAVRACVVARFCGHGACVANAVVAPDGKQLASGGRDGRVGFWEFAGSGGQPLGLDPTHTGEVWGAAWSADGKTLATGSFDKTVRLWDADRRAVRATL